jgi:hypothetical protein
MRRADAIYKDGVLASVVLPKFRITNSKITASVVQAFIASPNGIFAAIQVF